MSKTSLCLFFLFIGGLASAQNVEEVVYKTSDYHGLSAQSIYTPIGCSASGTSLAHLPSLAHSDCRYMLLKASWASLETSPGIFNFSSLISQINIVKSYNKKYSIAISAGGPGTPSWLKSTMNVPSMPYVFRSENYDLPLWWDTTVLSRMKILADTLGAHFNSDTSLILVYVPQMTVNGIEGHLNGINMTSFYSYGFTQTRWVDAAKETAKNFAMAFPDKALAFEVHDIDGTYTVPANILNDLYNDAELCQRIGAGIWWLSGKTSYQENLLTVLQNFQGSKYAQMIGRSDQTERFKDGNIATAFSQAKQLNIRYIEPWIYEYQNNTVDSLLSDFNHWADLNFILYSKPCSVQVSVENFDIDFDLIEILPNPASEFFTFNFIDQNKPFKVKLYSVSGQLLMTFFNEKTINISTLEPGVFFVKLMGSKIEKTFKVIKI